eukprot:g398.t1
MSEIQVLTLLNNLIEEAYQYLTMVDISGKVDGFSLKQDIIAQKTFLEKCRDNHNFNELKPVSIKTRTATIVNSVLKNLGVEVPYPFTPRGVATGDYSHTLKSYPLHPLTSILGSGYDSRTDLTRSNVYRWSPLQGRVLTNYKGHMLRIPQGVIVSNLQETQETDNLDIFFHASDKARRICSEADISGIGACVLSDVVRHVDELAADNIVLVESTKEIKAAHVTMKYEIDDPAKTMSPNLASLGCKLIPRKSPQESRVTCSRVNSKEMKLRIPPSCTSKYKFCPELTDMRKDETYKALIDPVGEDSLGDILHLLFFESKASKDAAAYTGHGIRQNNIQWAWRQAMKPIAKYVTTLNVATTLDFQLEGALSALDADFQTMVMDLPDCKIEFAQVSEDPDFFDVGEGIFDEIPKSNMPDGDIEIPQCNGQDITQLKTLLNTFGTHVLVESSVGGRIVTSYQIALNDVVAADNDAPAVAIAKMIRQLRSEEHLVDSKNVQTVMHRRHNDFIGKSDGYDAGEDGRRSHQDQSRASEMPTNSSSSAHRHASSLNSASVIRRTRSVIGGHRLPIAQLGGGVMDRKETQEWKQTLSTYGAPLKKSVVEIEEMLKHPLMIRAAYLHCGPSGAISMSSLRKKWWNEGKPTNAAYDFWSVLMADLFESKSYKYSTTAWDAMKSNECGKMVHRKFYLLKNFIKYANVKAQGVFVERKRDFQLFFETRSREIQMERTYEAWNRAMYAVREIQTGMDLESTIYALWRKVINAVDKNGVELSSKLYTPLLEYISSAHKFSRACSQRCETQRLLYLKENSLSGRRWGEQSIGRHRSFVLASDTDVHHDPFGTFVDVFNSIEFMGPSEVPASDADNIVAPDQEETSSSESGGESSKSAAGTNNDAVPLETFPSTPRLVANSMMTRCQEECKWRKMRIVDTAYGVRNQEEQNHKDLFRSALSMSNMMCVEMMRAEFDPTSKIVDTGPDGYPAAVYCSNLPSQWESDMCKALGNLMWQLMSDRADIPSNNMLSNHRLMYAATELMTRSPDFIRFRYMTNRMETVPVVEGVVAPERIRQDRILGMLVAKAPKKFPLSPRIMGHSMPKEAKENMAKNEYSTVADWDNLARPTEFCRQLLSAHTFENSREWYDMITGTSMDPTVQSERYDTQWHLIRQNIMALQQERDQAQGKGEGAVAMIEAQIDEANQNLWCSHYSLMQTRVLEELKANEVNRKMAECYICLKANQGASKKDICEPFPKASESDGVNKKIKAMIQEWISKVKSRGAKDQKRAGVIFNQWGFRPKEKVSCNGALLDPRKAEEDVKNELQSAITGSQFSDEDCDFALEALEHIVESKVEILSIVSGTQVLNHEKCSKMEKCPDADDACKRKRTECRKRLMISFEKLHALVIDEATGSVKDLYRSYDDLFRSYGNIGRTPCVDMQMCNIYAENSLRDWIRRNSVSKIAFAEAGGEGKMPQSQIPGLDYAKDLEKLAGQFVPRMESNPSYGPLGKWDS